jgi:alginate O-acetyltransferase complex protein AlgI
MITVDWQWISNLFLYNEESPLLYHSGFFLFIFSLFLVFYGMVLRKDWLRSALLILFGFYIYYKASGVFLVLLIATISGDYFFAKWITNSQTKIRKKALLVTSILFSLSFLMYFKYKNFFLENISAIVGSEYSLEKLILPIGISFYTFQSISFIVDIYSNKIALPKYRDYLLYMTFFPHLVAGPIVRARDFMPQLKSYVKITVSDIKEAIYLIIKGFVKKAIIGDFVAQYSDLIFDDPKLYSSAEQLVGILCYTLQIFCDFSGYTDMAIGIALLLGYRLCTNFDSPYKSLNITQFWRKWHISLSSWLRDYIYIPLGGNRRGLLLQLLFLLITMLIGGFWHGANWKFVFWGAGHGLLLIAHKMIAMYWKDNYLASTRVFKFLSWFLTFSVVALLWVPFRASSLDDALFIYTSLFSGIDLKMIYGLMQANEELIIFIVLGFSFTALNAGMKERMKKWFVRQDFIVITIIFIVLIQVMFQYQAATVEPFIYFQF